MTHIHPSAFIVVWDDGVAGTGLGLVAGGCNYLALQLAFGMYPPSMISALYWGLSGVIAGAIQGAFIRQYIASRLRWLAASSISWMVAGVSLDRFAVLTRRSDSLWIQLLEPVLWILGGMLGCGLIGFCQWLLLRSHLRAAWWWLIMSVVLGAGAGMVAMSIQPIAAP